MIVPSPVDANNGAAPDMVLSFRHRDSLAQALSRLGRRVVAARRAEGIAERVKALNGHILIIDARDAGIEALQAVEHCAEALAPRECELIVVLSEQEAELAPAMVAAGAKHIVAAPWHDWAFEATLLSADARQPSAQLRPSTILGRWQADIASGLLQLAPESDADIAASFGGAGDVRSVLRRLPGTERAAAFAAMRRLMAGEAHAALIQSIGERRVVHHIGCRVTMIHGWIELLDPVVQGPDRDPETGMATLAAAKMEFARRQSNGQPFSIGVIEIARLALFNDMSGQEAGNTLLRRVARSVERQMHDDLGPDVLVARLSGARLLVLGPAGLDAGRLALALRAAAAMIMENGLPIVSGMPVALRVATGMVSPSQGLECIAAVSGRLAAPRALVRTVDVEALLADNQLRILFQPQFAMADGALIGAEALVRWQHPRRGEIAGGVLFAAAQASGFERQLSTEAWRGALASMASWPLEHNRLRIALNATAADVADPSMPAALLALAADHGISPERLTIEVTEAAIIPAIDDAVAALRRLRAAGMQVALDDFGTGYSGLSWLKRLPADYIKLDASFARDALGGGRDRAVLAGIIRLARSLGLAVLAEGVETEEQRSLLAAAGCTAWQGHLRAPALAEAAFIDLASKAG